MSRIRVAIIGLSSSSPSSWSMFAHLPYLLSPQGRASYTITALCNSSTEAAHKAIKDYNLDPSTKAYGSPDDLAKDDEIDLVVCCTRVDKHHQTILPSVKAGQNVFVEWPLANGLTQVRELAEEVRRSGSHTVIGLQSRYAPVVVKVRQMLREGRIEKLVSSEFLSDGGKTFHRNHIQSGRNYLVDLSVGGNFVHIGLGHFLDKIEYVLGDIQNVHSHMQNRHPTVEIRDPQSNAVLDKVHNTVPDHVVISGTLEPAEFISEDASVLVRFRSGPSFPGEPSLTWLFTGEKGDILIRAEKDPTLGAFAYSGAVTIRVRDFATEKVEEVSWDWEDWQRELPMPAWSVGSVYEAYAKSKEVADFDLALKRHVELDSLLSGWNGGENRTL